MEWVIFWLLCAFFASAIASGKNRGTGNWFVAGLLFGPFALLVAALPKLEDPGVEEARKSGVSDEFRKCPSCAEVIRREAIKCRYCGADLPPQPVPRSFLEELGREAGRSFSQGRKPPPDAGT